MQYTWENPDKAGLKDWVWRWKKPDRDDLATTRAPAGGHFRGWPHRLKEFKLLDPCCGSGHFLVSAFLMLVPMRMELDQLSLHEAVDAVLRDNLYGLEIDRRCTEIAAFNLAMAAWRLTGYRPLPQLNIACTGLSIGDNREQWMKVLDGQGAPTNLRFFFGQLFDLFRKAPTLGLINPHRFLGSGLLDEKSTAQLYRILFEVIAKESKSATDLHEMGIAAQGLLRAAELLTEHYTLVVTNVPYLGRGKQDIELKEHLEAHYPLGKADLATAFLLRCLEFCAEGGTTALVTPQNWLFLATYTKLRQTLLKHRTWNAVARLGPGAFETISGHVVNVALMMLSTTRPSDTQMISGINVSTARQPEEKAAMLCREGLAEITLLPQAEQLKNSDARVTLDVTSKSDLLGDYAYALQGVKTGDDGRFRRFFWELDSDGGGWPLYQTTVEATIPWGGLLYRIDMRLGTAAWARPQGMGAWGKAGVAVSQMSNFPVAIYSGAIFDSNMTPLIPKKQEFLSAIWSFTCDVSFYSAVRRIDLSLKVPNASFEKVPFDLIHWRKVAAEKYPDGLPEPESDDPTQWLFHGRPEHSSAPLQVAVARLLGYRWPAELDREMRLSRRARDLISLCDELLPFADKDGIVCIPPVRGEASAADRLLGLLARAYGRDWSTDVMTALLKDVGFGGKPLEVWLRDGFFSQHCELFHQRPFVWHIWDGLRDGFAALVNYHKLGRKNLETLIYTYLGDWIARCRDVAGASRSGIAVSDTDTEKKPDRDGPATISDPQEKLAAAENLKKRLEMILEGEAPYDIFVRWKPLQLQPIGWEPDLNDGVRMNIRPFMSAPDVKVKGAGVLRIKPRIKWDKDRGKEPKRPFSEYPWFWDWDGTVDFQSGPAFTGDRFNGCHYTIAFKRQARQQFGK